VAPGGSALPYLIAVIAALRCALLRFVFFPKLRRGRLDRRLVRRRA
jgi:hypothetical protein